MDYSKLLKWMAGHGNVVRAFYYTATYDDAEHDPLRPLVDWLDYNGYTVVTKPVKEFVDSEGRRKIKGNMDIELAIDMMLMAEHVDHILLFSGDGDFRRLIEAVQRKGVRVTVVSTIRSSPPMVADELRRQADHFLEHASVVAGALVEGAGPLPAVVADADLGPETVLDVGHRLAHDATAVVSARSWASSGRSTHVDRLHTQSLVSACSKGWKSTESRNSWPTSSHSRMTARASSRLAKYLVIEVNMPVPLLCLSSCR